MVSFFFERWRLRLNVQPISWLILCVVERKHRKPTCSVINCARSWHRDTSSIGIRTSQHGEVLTGALGTIISLTLWSAKLPRQQSLWTKSSNVFYLVSWLCGLTPGTCRIVLVKMALCAAWRLASQRTTFLPGQQIARPALAQCGNAPTPLHRRLREEQSHRLRPLVVCGRISSVQAVPAERRVQDQRSTPCTALVWWAVWCHKILMVHTLFSSRKVLIFCLYKIL